MYVCFIEQNNFVVGNFEQHVPASATRPATQLEDVSALNTVHVANTHRYLFYIAVTTACYQFIILSAYLETQPWLILYSVQKRFNYINKCL